MDFLRRWSSPSTNTLQNPSTPQLSVPNKDIEAGIIDSRPAEQPRPSALSLEIPKAREVPRPVAHRTPTGAQINDALDRAFARESIQHDDWNDLGGEQPHIVRDSTKPFVPSSR
jgi:hypothetical protein